MRDILFRGKRKDNGEWVEGYYVKSLWLETKQKLDVIIPTLNAFHFNSVTGWHSVDVSTVGQYTGITDKDGTKIFEGDILKGFEYPFFREEDGTHNYFAEVVWFDNSPAFGLWTFKNPESTVSGISHGNSDYIEDFDSEMWEVIGNIHDHKELLGVE